jgi:hypothetical protein
VNEYDSGKYDTISEVSGLTEGQEILTRFGFTDGDGEAYTFEWAWWSIIYSFAICILSVIISSVCLATVRFATGTSLDGGDGDVDDGDAESEDVVLPFQRVDLTFKDIHYTVTSSVGNEKLMLLKGIDGLVEAGKMTALVSIVWKKSFLA